MIEVSTTSTNIAIANKMASGRFRRDSPVLLGRSFSVTGASHSISDLAIAR
jgi:hypothetical protein